MRLEQLLDNRLVWRGGNSAPPPGLPTGYAELDAHIGGWPRAALSELLGGEGNALRLLLPTLANLSRQQQRWLCCINPPYLPYAPALQAHGLRLQRFLLLRRLEPAQALWAAEQAMRGGQCAAVLLWSAQVRPPQVRRLHLAAEQGDCLGVLCRPARARDEASAAVLRLLLAADIERLSLKVLKRPVGWGGAELELPRLVPDA